MVKKIEKSENMIKAFCCIQYRKKVTQLGDLLSIVAGIGIEPMTS